MKRLLTLLTALLIACAPAALAEREVLTAPDGMQYYGMLQEGRPVGFIAARSEAGDRLSFGVMRENGWQGTLFTVVLDEEGAFCRMIISSYENGVCCASLHCLSDSTLTLFSYTDGEITGSVVRQQDTATAYVITAGEASNPKPVTLSSLEGSALYTGSVSLHTQALDSRTIYCVQDDAGEIYAAVQVHADGSVIATRNFDGEALSYSAEDNTCTVGMMENDAWIPGAVIISGDGSTSRVK